MAKTRQTVLNPSERATKWHMMFLKKHTLHPGTCGVNSLSECLLTSQSYEWAVTAQTVIIQKKT